MVSVMVTSGDEARSGPDPIGAARDAAEAAGERFDQARADAGERLGAARDAASRGASAARARAEAAAHAIPKPRLRGVSHQWAFFCSLLAGAALVIFAPEGEAHLRRLDLRRQPLGAARGERPLSPGRLAAGGEALDAPPRPHDDLPADRGHLHAVRAPGARWRPRRSVVLIAVWAFAAAGVILNLAWWNAPKPVTAAVYLSTGWIAVVAFPQLWEGLGPVGFGLVALGGALYTAGAIVYARRSPDPRPEVFGYHEIFHLLVIVAAACQFAAVAIFALPAG